MSAERLDVLRADAAGKSRRVLTSWTACCARRSTPNSARGSRSASRSRISLAVTTLEDFDFLIPALHHHRVVRELATGRFIRLGENVLNLRVARRGQDASGDSARARGKPATRCSSPATALLAARQGPRPRHSSPIDELGCLPFERRSLHLFFTWWRSATSSAASSSPPTSSGAVRHCLGDEVLAAAIVDRLLHHGHTRMIGRELSIEGEAERRASRHRHGARSRRSARHQGESRSPQTKTNDQILVAQGSIPPSLDNENNASTRPAPR